MEKDLKELQNYARKFVNGDDVDFDADSLYAYAVAAQKGEIEEDPKSVDYIFRSILYFFFSEEIFADVIEKYPLTLPYLQDVASGIGTQALYDLAWYYRDERKDDKKFFEVVKLGAHTYPQGLSGGMGLVNQLIYNDLCCLELAGCYKDGRGVEKDYPMAFKYYLHYHTDHLMQKWATDQLSDEDLADLYAKMKAESDAGLNYPGLHWALAVMSVEGFGTPYDINAYRKYYEKETENYENGANDDSEYRELMEDYHCNIIAIGGFPQVKEPNAKYLRKGDVIRLGKYNHRDILWYVIRVDREKALLLSTDCLESGYIAWAKGSIFADDDSDRYQDSKVRYFTSEMEYSLFASDEAENGRDHRDYLLPNQEGDYVFLLDYDEIMENNQHSDMFLALAREQAKINGYDGRGVVVDEGTGASPWWTSTEGNEEGSLVFMDGYGEFEEGPMRRGDIGIRPAVWLKLNKE